MRKEPLKTGDRRKASKWLVTLYNQHACYSVAAWGMTKRNAFDNAVKKAGSEFIKCGEDATKRDHWAVYHDMWHGHVVRYVTRRTARYGCNDPIGLGIQIERAEHIDWLNNVK